jgi:hypothetical protein
MAVLSGETAQMLGAVGESSGALPHLFVFHLQGVAVTSTKRVYEYAARIFGTLEYFLGFFCSL